MEFFRWLVERFREYLNPYPPPALPRMRLGPKETKQNALMVCAAKLI